MLISVHIKMTTWQKPSFGVFDFNNSKNHFSVSNFVANRNGTFLLHFSKEAVFELRNYNPNMDQTGNKVFKLDLDSQQLIDLQDSPRLSESLWVPVALEHPMVLRQGDTIRFGKQQLRVSSINLDLSAQRKPVIPSDNSTARPMRTNSGVFESGSTCRICLEPNNLESPFVDICDCTRQMPMHLNCVREWMKRKCETKKSNRVVFFNLSEVFCEVCKVEFPGRVVVHGQEHLLFEPDVDHSRRNIVFDIIDKKSFEVKGYCVLFFDGLSESFTIGRTEDNDVTFNELSISRSHAELRLTKSGIVLEDLKSKYGTLYKVSKLDFLGRKSTNYVQIDKFLFEFHTFGGDRCFCPVPSAQIRVVEAFTGSLPLRRTLGVSKSERVLKPLAVNKPAPVEPSTQQTLRDQLEALREKGRTLQFRKQQTPTVHFESQLPQPVVVSTVKKQIADEISPKLRPIDVFDFDDPQKTEPDAKPLRTMSTKALIKLPESESQKLPNKPQLRNFATVNEWLPRDRHANLRTARDVDDSFFNEENSADRASNNSRLSFRFN